ncbi:MAG: carbonic anhydrase [Myxococcales bacterium FL481]|nr:MAG: carbonic anhydrase [Myxococcales bacterium FL481]
MPSSTVNPPISDSTPDAAAPREATEAPLDVLLRRNEAYLASHVARPPLPAMNTIVVCCLDARIDPASFLGLAPGEALVVRNAGGRVTPAVLEELGAILAMVRLATGRAVTPDIVLVHHTDCGLEHFARPEMAAGIAKGSGVARAVIDDLAIHDHYASLRDDLSRLRDASSMPRGCRVSGLRYDEATGHAETVFANETI